MQLRRDLVEAMVAHARRDHPDEACGILAGPEGSGRPGRFIPMLNAARSPTYFEFDPTEWLKVHRELSANDEEVVVIYHSHTATPAYPSVTDVRKAGEFAQLLPSPHYVLVSTRDPDSDELRSYRIVGGQVTEEEVRVVEALPVEHTRT